MDLGGLGVESAWELSHRATHLGEIVGGQLRVYFEIISLSVRKKNTVDDLVTN
jgi:hypothetical protein